MALNEDTRVKIPAILHLCRLGYKYLSLKEISKADKEKRTIKMTYLSEWFQKYVKIWEDFLISINYNYLPQETMKGLYLGIILKIKNLEVAKVTGEFRITDESKTEIDSKLIIEIEDIENEIGKLRSMIKKDSRFSDKVELNIRINEMNEQHRELVRRLNNG